MTATTVKSTKLTAMSVTDPHTMQVAGSTGGRLQICSDTTEAATTSLDETGDAIIMALPLPSNAVVHSLVIFNDDLDTGGTSGAVDVGVYNGPTKFKDGSTTYQPYGIVDQDAFASAITTLTAANTSGVQIRFESAANAGDVANGCKQLWDALGLAADPQCTLLVGITVTTAMTTPQAGTITMCAEWSV